VSEVYFNHNLPKNVVAPSLGAYLAGYVLPKDGSVILFGFVFESYVDHTLDRLLGDLNSGKLRVESPEPLRDLVYGEVSIVAELHSASLRVGRADGTRSSGPVCIRDLKAENIAVRATIREGVLVSVEEVLLFDLELLQVLVRSGYPAEDRARGTWQYYPPDSPDGMIVDAPNADEEDFINKRLSWDLFCLGIDTLRVLIPPPANKRNYRDVAIDGTWKTLVRRGGQGTILDAEIECMFDRSLDCRERAQAIRSKLSYQARR
jgi:hypothetical protein